MWFNLNWCPDPRTFITTTPDFNSKVGLYYVGETKKPQELTSRLSDQCLKAVNEFN
jgi:hypothetical protein